jgi:hypothetical protein
MDSSKRHLHVRNEVTEFLALGPLPPSRSADETHLTRLTEALMRISAPVSEEEAILLASAFGPDECFGLAWTLIHLIESAPGGAPLDRIPMIDNEWIRLLRERAGRA